MRISPFGHQDGLPWLGLACAALLMGAGAVAPAAAVTFDDRIDVVAGTQPLGVAIADLDGDGRQDLLTTVFEDDVLAVFRQVRGEERVLFAEAVEVAAGLHPQEIVVADFDGDGKPDVAVGNSGRSGGGTLALFRNTSSPGTISFATRVDYPADTARRLTAGEVDGDGKPDIVVSSNSPHELLVFRNTSTVGTISFSQDLVLAAANDPSSIALADMDGDGKEDIIAPIDKEDIVSIYPNTSTTGSVSFGTRLDFAAGAWADGPGIGQFDGEGGLDIVVANVFLDQVSLLLNRSTPGSFAFDAPVAFAVGSEPRETEVGDLDGDGLPEVVVQNVDDRVIVMTTVRDGGSVSLEVAAELASDSGPFLSALGDLDGDGGLDVVTGQHESGSVGIWINATESATSPQHLLLCEVAPEGAEFIELVNPTGAAIGLEDYYLSDDQEYALLAGGAAGAGGPAPSIHSSDFIVRFPTGPPVEPGGVVVVALDGAGFLAEHGFRADYEIRATDGETPDMELVAGSLSATLTDDGEHVVLFTWDGAADPVSDLVTDVDMVRVGTPTVGGSNDLADKTGVTVDGPDADADASTYLDDAFRMPVASSDPGSGESVKRVLAEGASEVGEGGNGPTGDDETSEDILVTWDSEFEYTPADPGTCCLTMPCYYASVNPTDKGTLRATLHPVIDDHLRFTYTSSTRTDTWDILELADEDPLDPSQVVDVYQNAPYPKDQVDYTREHAWPKTYGFPDDLVSNYPFTDAHHLFLADQSYNSSRQDKLYRDCHSGCTEWTTVEYDGRGGGSGIYPGLSNWTETGTWETWPGRQGDVARAILYLDLRYEGGAHGVTGVTEPNLHVTDDEAKIVGSSTGSNRAEAYMGILSDLLEWHAADPVDFRERWRNDVVYRYQRNRNPFIDHPEWVECLYGTICPGVDLTVIKDDGWPDAVAGETVTYTIEVGNLGPDSVAGAVVTDLFDPQRFDVGAIAWTCAPVAGAGGGTACPASGTAADLETGVEVDVEVGDAVVFTVECPVLASASGSLVNTAEVAPPEGIFERDASSNASTDTDDLPALGTCGQPDQRVLTDQTVTTTEVAEACTSITAGAGFRIESPGDVTLRAGERVVLGDGFSVGSGGRLVLEVDPALKP